MRHRIGTHLDLTPTSYSNMHVTLIYIYRDKIILYILFWNVCTYQHTLDTDLSHYLYVQRVRAGHSNEIDKTVHLITTSTKTDQCHQIAVIMNETALAKEGSAVSQALPLPFSSQVLTPIAPPTPPASSRAAGEGGGGASAGFWATPLLYFLLAARGVAAGLAPLHGPGAGQAGGGSGALAPARSLVSHFLPFKSRGTDEVFHWLFICWTSSTLTATS